jgi:hypothetical protein
MSFRGGSFWRGFGLAKSLAKIDIEKDNPVFS